jgi:ferredoxin-NADP reductase
MKRIEYKIRKLELVGESVIHLNLVPKNDNSIISFRPGQYGLISFLDGHVLSSERPFSFLSSPLDQTALEFGFKVFGQFTTEFSQLKPGDSIFIRGPYGSFYFDENKHKEAVFLSAGIGITPFMSIFRYATAKKIPNKLTLLYSNRTMPEIPFLTEIKNLEKANKNFKANFYLTCEGTPTFQGCVPGRINREEISKKIGTNVENKTFFICGPQLFTESMTKILEELGVKPKNIKTEGFTLSPPSFFEKGTWTFPLAIGATTLMMIASLYPIVSFENSKALAKSEIVKTNQEKFTRIASINQQIIDTKNTLLADQLAKTKTVNIVIPGTTQIITPDPIITQTTVPTNTPTTKTITQSTPQKTTVTKSTPKPKPTPKPRTTLS